MIGNIRYFGKDQVPHYDLLADSIAYVTHVKFKNDYWKAYPLLKKTSRSEMEDTRKEANSQIFISKSGERKVRENKLTYHKFMLKNFIRFFQVEPENNPGIHKKIIQLYPPLRLMMYVQSVRGVKIDEECEVVCDESEGELLDLPFIVSTVQTFYDPESQKEVTVRMVHHLRESEALREELEKSVSSKASISRFGASVLSSVNHSKIVFEYENSVLDVRGFCLGSEICSLENRNEWVKEIPFEHIMLVMDKVHTGVARLM